MLVSNCNKIINVSCGCTVYIPDILLTSYARLSVGELVSTGCTMIQYIIDWHLDASYTPDSPELTEEQILALPIVLVSGKNKTLNPEIEKEHPFSGNGAITVTFSGKLYPVLRYIKTEQGEIYARPIRCFQYCEDLNTNLPAVVINKLECGVEGGSPSPEYDYRIYYSTGGLNKNNSFNYTITPPDIPIYGRKYVAILFTPATVNDTIAVYYKDELIPMYNINAGYDAPAANDASNPKTLNTQSVKFVLDYTEGRTVQVDDYLRVEIIGSGSTDTTWEVQLICLDANAFKIGPEYTESQCNYFNTSLREFKPLNQWVPDVAHWSDIEGGINNCAYTVTLFMNNVISADYANYSITPNPPCVANLCKYNQISSTTSANSFNNIFGSIDVGKLTGLLYNRTSTWDQSSWTTGSNGSWKGKARAKYDFHYNGISGKFTFIFHNAIDYEVGVYQDHIEHSTNSATVGSGSTLYIPKTDPLTPECIANMREPWHYRILEHFWVVNTPPTFNDTDNTTWDCGDCGWAYGQRVFRYFLGSEIRWNPRISDAFVSDGAEIRFKAIVRGVAYTAPTVTNVTGDLTYLVINRIPNLVPNPDPINHPRTCANELGNWQTDTVAVWGTNGTLDVVGPGGITETLTVSGSITDAVIAFGNDTTGNPGGITNIQLYASAGIELFPYTDFVGIMEITPYEGLRDDFNQYFTIQQEEDALICNTGRLTTALRMIGTAMGGTSCRTLTLNVAPVTKWTAGTIVRGKTSGATCEIVSFIRTNFNDLSIEPLQYDIKSTVNLTFQSGEVLEASTDGGITWGNEVAQALGRPTVSAQKATFSGTTGCLTGVFTNSWTIFVNTVDEVCKDFYHYYSYPLESLNTLCLDYPGDGSGWYKVGQGSRYNIFYTTVEFYRSPAEEVGMLPSQVVAFRKGNFRIYNRLDSSGKIINVLKLNVAPTTEWGIGDYIRGQLSGAQCQIISKITDLTYYVTTPTGTYRDNEVVGKYASGTWSKLADQTVGAPRIVGDLIYEEYNGTQSYP